MQTKRTTMIAKTTGLLATLLLGVGCTVGADAGQDSSQFELSSKTQAAFEPTWAGGKLCQLSFAGSPSINHDQYAIWNIGANGIVDAPYNTAARADIWAVFGTNPPANQVHHVDGYSGFDHYHVVSAFPGTAGYDGTYDLLTAWPGPNYNAATYTSATSIPQLQAQFDAGVLVPLTLPEIGFPELVLFAPVACN